MPSIKLTNLLLAVTIASRTNGTRPLARPRNCHCLPRLMRTVKRTYKFVGLVASLGLSQSLKAPAAAKKPKKEHATLRGIVDGEVN